MQDWSLDVHASAAEVTSAVIPALLCFRLSLAVCLLWVL